VSEICRVITNQVKQKLYLVGYLLIRALFVLTVLFGMVYSYHEDLFKSNICSIRYSD